MSATTDISGGEAAQRSLDFVILHVGVDEFIWTLMKGLASTAGYSFLERRLYIICVSASAAQLASSSSILPTATMKPDMPDIWTVAFGKLLELNSGSANIAVLAVTFAKATMPAATAGRGRHR